MEQQQQQHNNNKMEESKVEEILMLDKKRTLESQSGTSGGTVQINQFPAVFSANGAPDSSNRFVNFWRENRALCENSKQMSTLQVGDKHCQFAEHSCFSAKTDPT